MEEHEERNAENSAEQLEEKTVEQNCGVSAEAPPDNPASPGVPGGEPAENGEPSGAESSDTSGGEPTEDTENDERLNAALKKLGGSLENLSEALGRVSRSLEGLQEARRTYARLGWAMFVLLPVTYLLQIPAAVLLNRFSPDWQDTWLLWAVSFAPLYVVAIPLALWLLRPIPVRPPEERVLGPLRFAALVPVSLTLTYAGSAVSMLLLHLLNRTFGTSAENPLADVLTGTPAPLLRTALFVCAAPVLEELVFRKAVLDRTRVYGEKLAVLVSALVFGLSHGNLSQFVYALLLGLLFGYVYLRTGRVRYTIVLHMFVNFLGAVAAPFVLRYAEGAETGNLTGTGGAVVMGFGLTVLLLCGGGIALLADNWRNLHFETADLELPRGVRLRTAFAHPGMLFLFVCFVVTSVLTLLNT